MTESQHHHENKAELEGETQEPEPAHKRVIHKSGVVIDLCPKCLEDLSNEIHKELCILGVKTACDNCGSGIIIEVEGD